MTRRDENTGVFAHLLVPMQLKEMRHTPWKMDDLEKGRFL